MTPIPLILPNYVVCQLGVVLGPEHTDVHLAFLDPGTKGTMA